MYDIRKITTDEVDAAIALSEYCFIYQLEGEARVERAAFMSDHYVLGAFHNNTMVAKTHIIPHHVLVAGREMLMGGIASVATYPEHRRRGLVNRLLAAAMEEMRQAGQVVSYLHPFDINFYRQYGYELMSSYKEITVLAADLRAPGAWSGTMERKAPLDALHDLSRVYHRYANNFTGMLVRPPAWWRYTLFDGMTAAVYTDDEGEPRGYLLYLIKDKEMQVEEFIYLDEASRRGLWDFIAKHDSMIEKAVITSVLHDQMAFLLPNPEVRTEVFSDFMARVVLVNEFLQHIVAGEPQEHEWVIGIRDTFAPWNTGIYTVQGSAVSFTSANHEDISRDTLARGGLAMDITSFSAMMLGYVTPQFLFASGKIEAEASAVSKFARALTIKPSAFLDYF